MAQITYFMMPLVILNGTYRYWHYYIQDELSNVTLLEATYVCFRKSLYFDCLLVGVVAVAVTMLRSKLTNDLFMPLARRLHTPVAMQNKVPENMWKALFYTLTWLYSLNVVLLRRPQWLTKPLSIWEGWSIDMRIPWDIYIEYIIQCGFYVHSVYATIYMDVHRKDYLIMLFHHFVTLTLISFSYITRQHASGALVLFLHDISDVFLELWKLNSNLRWRRDGKHYNTHDQLANLCFVIFVSSWFVCRLYLYPLIVIRACFHDVYDVLGPESELASFWPLFALMLVFLLAMNIYWFWLMVSGLVRYLFIGDLREVDDVREYESATDIYESEHPQHAAAQNGFHAKTQ